MKYNEKNKPLVCMMTQSTCYKGTRKMKVKGVLWHSTGANNPNIKRYVQPDDDASNRTELLRLIGTNTNKNDWNHIYREAGVNAWIGRLADGTVTTVQTLPWDHAPWGCGSGSKGSCNDGWIQFEICEDGLADKTYFDKVYKEACELTAYLCKMYGIDPEGTVTVKGVRIPTILCHRDSYRLGFGGDHSDVYPWFEHFGKTMDDVRRDVANLLDSREDKPMTQNETRELEALRQRVAELEAKKEKVYHYWSEIPKWALKPLRALYEGGYFSGASPADLELSQTKMEILVVLANMLKKQGVLKY